MTAVAVTAEETYSNVARRTEVLGWLWDGGEINGAVSSVFGGSDLLAIIGRDRERLAIVLC